MGKWSGGLLASAALVALVAFVGGCKSMSPKSTKEVQEEGQKRAGSYDGARGPHGGMQTAKKKPTAEEEATAAAAKEIERKGLEAERQDAKLQEMTDEPAPPDPTKAQDRD